MKKLVFVLFILPISFNISSQIKDESYLDIDFWEFKTKLSYAVLKKDKVLLELLLHEVVIDCWDAFDCAGKGGCGKKQFIEVFFNDNESDQWQILKSILRFGFKRKKDSLGYNFSAPSYTVMDRSIVILAENLNIRKAPRLTAKVLGQISFSTVKCALDSEGNPIIYNREWVKIILENGFEGYVMKQYTSSVIDRRLKVAKINGEWKIVEYYCLMNI
ncbi:SH3 domain-containing protein [Winogradskyella maritima]|uniref:SH3 domain-containing protein n=1 Tax=Winogradskyella maritima TaxID=1517766 RepID=A0ABV8AJM8_9FLAO|nr:SH3 domain-containing protein [Winogradskyella maritima]